MAKRWSQKATTIKVQPVAYRTGSTHRHADRLARADRGRPRTCYLHRLHVRGWSNDLMGLRQPRLG
jgi:hypothetical protein